MLLALLLSTSVQLDNHVPTWTEIGQNEHDKIERKKLRLVRNSYTRIDQAPPPNTKTGNWCRYYLGEQNCGFQTDEFCRMTLNDYRDPTGYCEKKN